MIPEKTVKKIRDAEYFSVLSVRLPINTRKELKKKALDESRTESQQALFYIRKGLEMR